MHSNVRSSPASLLPIGIFCVASANLLITLLGLPLDGLRLLTGVVLVGFAPGYALVLALRKAPGDLQCHLVLSAPLSLVLTVLIGITVSLLGLSLSDHALLVGMWLCISLLFGVSAVRTALRRGNKASAGKEGPAEPQLAPATNRRSPWVIIAGLVAVTLSLGWAGTQILPAAQPPVTPFTSLAVEQSAAGQQQLVLESHEAEPAIYTLVVLADGVSVGSWEQFELAPGGREHVVLPATSQRVEARLYRDGQTTPYRRVWVEALTNEQ